MLDAQLQRLSFIMKNLCLCQLLGSLCGLLAKKCLIGHFYLGLSSKPLSSGVRFGTLYADLGIKLCMA